MRAARRVFIDRGYGGASLEAIAEEAGFSRGVVYSQFGSKADMFFALLECRIEERAAQNERIATELAGAEALQELIRAAHLDTAAEHGMVVSADQFRALAMRDPELNRRYADAHARTVEKFASVFERVFAGVGRKPPVPARSMAEFLLAGYAGIALERAANPDAIPDQRRGPADSACSWPRRHGRPTTMTGRAWDRFRRGVLTQTWPPRRSS